MRRNKSKPSIKSKKTAQLTSDQLRQLFFAKCKDREHIYEWIKLFWGVNLPKTTISRYSNCNPLDSVWEIYKACVWDKKGLDILYIAPRGGGKCSLKGTLVPIKNSGLRKIEDVKVGDELWSGFNWQKVLKTFDEGILDGVYLKTKNGLKLTGSVNHRVLIADKESGITWKHISDLTKDDFVACSGNADFALNQMEFDDGWLIGAVVGDGSIVDTIKNKRVDFCSGDELVSFKYKQIIFNKFNKIPREWQLSSNSIGYQVNSSDLISWIKSYIDGRLCYHKKLKTLDHSDSFLAGFLVGMFDTDGSKDEMTLANKDLVEQVSHILTKFGVFNRIIDNRKKPRYSQFIKRDITYHSVHFISKLPIFLLPIGNKREFFKLESDKRREQYRYPSYVVDFFIKELREIYNLHNGWMTRDGEKKRVQIPFIDHLSTRGDFIEGKKIHTWAQWSHEVGLYDLSERLSIIADCYFQSVIEVGKETGHFYDLSVEEDHSYTSNGIVSHNTLGVAITESALMFHDRRGAVHIGAIEKQAKRAYSYFQTFLQKNKEILSPLVEKSVIEKTTLIIDNEPVTLECLPCTMSSLNGPHEACCVMDELDTLSPEGLSAYKQINGIPVRHRLTGAPPVKIGISTRKSAYGLVQRQMDTALAQGRSIKIWNQIDLTERCEPSRHGTEEITLFVDQMRMHHVPQEEFEKLTEDKKKDYIAYQATDGCAKCPLFSVCLGDLKNQDPEMTAEKSTMITGINDLITRIKGADTDWVLAELMCLKPSTEGLVFKEFEKSRHVVSWNKMWEKLTKEIPTEEIDEVKFLKEIHKRKLPIYGGIDWGWSAPSTFIAAAVDQDDNVFVLRAFGLTKTNDPTFIHLVKTKFHRLYRIQMYYPDIANGSAVDLMKTAGLPVASKIDKSENLGVQVIKRLLNTPGTSEVKLFISDENCAMMVHEFERYHYEKDGAGETIDGKFAKEFDHTIDPLRYILTAVMGKSRFIISHDMLSIDIDKPLRAEDGSYYRAPSFYELARENSIQVTPTESRPFNRGDTEEEEEPGGMLWSF